MNEAQRMLVESAMLHYFNSILDKLPKSAEKDKLIARWQQCWNILSK